MPAPIFLAALSQIATYSIPISKAKSTQLMSQPWKRLVADDEFSPAPQLLQQGVKLYQAQQYPEAIKVLQQAAQVFQTQNDPRSQALALNYLSLTYQQMGKWSNATKVIADSLALLHAGANQGNSQAYSSVLAKVLNTQGRLQLSLGQSETALTSWQKATTAYTQIGDPEGIIVSQINQAQAFQALGLYRRAIITLTQVNQTLQQQPDSLLKATGLLSLGNALRVVGNLDQSNGTQINRLGSKQVLEQSLAIAQRLQLPEVVAEIQLSLGNTAEAQQNIAEALEFYRAAATPSISPPIQLQANLNQLHLLVQEQWLAAQIVPKIQSQLAVPPSRKTIYARINLAQSLIQLKQTHADSTFSWLEISQILATAVQQARSLGDQRAEAYALGNLGGVYEQTQQYSSAQSLTQQALILAQAINAPDIAYR